MFPPQRERSVVSMRAMSGNDTNTDLSEAEAAVLDILQEGARTTGYINDNVEYSPAHVNTQLRILVGKGYIRTVHEPTGLYELVDDPRTDGIDMNQNAETENNEQ
jgi:DNA-binding MarR family transcriptional regulator